MLALCPACGARFNFPFVTDELRDEVEAQKAARRGRSGWQIAQPWVWGAAATIVMGLVIALVWALTVFPAMLAQRAEANTYLHQAADQAAQGKYAEARDTYLQLVNLHPDTVSDLKLREQIDFARQQASVMDDRANGMPVPGSAPAAPSPVVVAKPLSPQTRPTATGKPAIASAIPTPPAPPPNPAPAAKLADFVPPLPPIRPINSSAGLTDLQINDSIHRAVDYLMGEMDRERFEVRQGMVEPGAYHTGLDACASTPW